MTETFKNLPVVHPDREPLTEAEAMRVGDSAYRLSRLRRFYQEAEGKGGSIVVGTPTAWQPAPSIALGGLSLQAALALLIEREELFLASFNVKMEKPFEPHHFNP